MSDESRAPLTGPGWYWLSFADPTLPKGSQFLGAAIVEANGMASAPIVAHALGINPGGQILMVEIPPDKLPAPEYRNRLLDRETAEAI